MVFASKLIINCSVDSNALEATCGNLGMISKS